MNRVDKVYNEIEQFIKNTKNKAFEVELDNFTFKEKETLRNRLLCNGVPAEFHTECKKSYMGVWVQK